MIRWNAATETKFQELHRLELDCKDVFGMSYTLMDPHSIVVLTSRFKNQFQAVDLTTGGVVWKHDVAIGGIPIQPGDVSSTADGWVYVANSNTLLVLGASDGYHIATLFEDSNLTHIKKVVWSGNKLAIRHGQQSDKIRCYNISFGMTGDDTLRLP